MKKLMLAILSLLLCQGCIQLGGDTQPTRYYLLEPVATPISAAASETVKINLGPIEFPSYLDRLQIVTRDSNNAIITAQLDRWAEPLSENFYRTLQENLHRHLGNAEIQLAPWNINEKPDYQIALMVNSFDAILGQRVNVDIRWEIIPFKEAGKKIRGRFLGQAEIDNSYARMVKELSQSLAKLSGELVDRM